MDIKPPNPLSKLTTSQLQGLKLKINQLLEVKILNLKNESLTLILQASQPSKPIHVKSNLPIESKPGQTLQLQVIKLQPVLEFEVLKTSVDLKQSPAEQTAPLQDKKKLLLKQFIPTAETIKHAKNTKPPYSAISFVFSAKIIATDADKIQIKTETKIPVELTTQQKKSEHQVLTIPKEQLIQHSSKQQLVEIQHFKVGQKIQLEVSAKPDQVLAFKLMDVNTPKLTVGQHFTAKVIEIKNDKIQLQLLPNNPPVNFSTSEKSTGTPTSVILLDKNQFQPAAFQSSTLPAQNKIDSMPAALSIKPGQQIQFEVVKTGIHPEFKLIDRNISIEPTGQQVLNTIKHMLPIQQPPSEFINQLVKNLPKINNNETISDNLKRLAREILDSLPQIKDAKNPDQLKKTIVQSGLFLESKLNQHTDETKLTIEGDFKNKLLKFQQALTQELESKNNQKTQTSELNLIKEMLQKTESSLAKIILNQLTSLPKEEGARQMWILDLPFLTKEAAESVKIEIDREQQSNNDKKEENWGVTLTMTPPGLATIHCKISCFGKNINTRFWSDSDVVVKKITHHLGYLESLLKAAGLETGHLSAHKGSESENSHQKITNQKLFDQKA